MPLHPITFRMSIRQMKENNAAMNNGDNGTCSILAWRGWDHELPDILCEYYKTVYKHEVSFYWIHYVGGSEFVSRLHRWPNDLPKCDVVIADREILQSFAIDGRLVPLSVTAGETNAILRSYPQWLQRCVITSGDCLFAVPIRWGLTSVLVRKDYLRHVDSDSMSDLLKPSHQLLIWSPKGYFLPSMGMLAMAVNPRQPFVLSADQFARLEQLMQVLSEREIHVAKYVQEFGATLTSVSPEIAVCGGDWIISSMERYDKGVYSHIVDKYEYVFPSDSGPLMFFEMAAVLSSGCNTPAGINMVKLLSREDVRQRVETMSLKYGNYVSNPTTDDRKVIGPGFKFYSPGQIADKALPRRLPLDHQLQPAVFEWKRVWMKTLMRQIEGYTRE